MTFRKFEYRDLTPPEGQQPLPGGAARYEEPVFQRGSGSQAGSSIQKKSGSFHLDGNVAGQLGIDERERLAQEARVEKEIARRWEKASEQAEAAGYSKGLEEGKQEAFRAELPRIAEKVARLDGLLQLLDSARERIFTANETFLMDLIARVAGMVALKEVELDKEYIRRVVLTLLQQLGQKDDLKIYLSESDAGNIEGLRAVIEKEQGKLTNTVIEASPEIPVGGCKIETRFGVVDASVATQIENVMKAIRAQ